MYSMYIYIYVCMDGWMDRLISIYVIYIYTQCEAPKISKLVYNSNNYGLWHIVTGAYKPTYNWVASHCMYNIYIVLYIYSIIYI